MVIACLGVRETEGGREREGERERERERKREREIISHKPPYHRYNSNHTD